MADTIDQQFVEYIAKSLVDNPDEVRVERIIDERGVLLQLHVAPGDLGRVIGRAGSTAKSIRTLLRALSVKNDARYNLKIIEPEEDDYHSRPSSDDTTDDAAQDSPVADVTADDQEADVETETPEQVEETPEPEAEAEVEPEEDEESDLVSRSRKEIADLTDDLDD
ncbi:MAG: KH domain-containing protein [Candidatus Saccharimonadales bacterium]